MGHVWAARTKGKLGFSRTVALKVVRPEYAADQEYARMLTDEASVAAAVQHPNVCELLEFDESDGLLYLVMEWVPGDSLGGLMHHGDKLRPFSFYSAARICADAAAGLHAAHEAVGADGVSLGIVHRDVSPPNILVSVDGLVKVSDFGIAKARYQLHAKTRTGEVKGKFGYIPPEQILGAGKVTRQADIYALGCVLYVATLGLRPFGSGPKAMPKILNGRYRRPRDLYPDYPKGLEDIICRALSLDPANRQPTAEVLRRELEEWIASTGKVITSVDIGRSVRKRLTPERQRIIEHLRGAGKALLQAMADRSAADLGDDGTQTPTAGSGVIDVPLSLQDAGTPSKSGDNDRTVTDLLALAVADAVARQSQLPPTPGETSGISGISTSDWAERSSAAASPQPGAEPRPPLPENRAARLEVSAAPASSLAPTPHVSDAPGASVGTLQRAPSPLPPAPSSFRAPTRSADTPLLNGGTFADPQISAIPTVRPAMGGASVAAAAPSLTPQGTRVGSARSKVALRWLGLGLGLLMALGLTLLWRLTRR